MFVVHVQAYGFDLIFFGFERWLHTVPNFGVMCTPYSLVTTVDLSTNFTKSSDRAHERKYVRHRTWLSLPNHFTGISHRYRINPWKKFINNFVIAQTLEAVITVSEYIFMNSNPPICCNQQFVCSDLDWEARIQLNFVFFDCCCC